MKQNKSQSFNKNIISVIGITTVIILTLFLSQKFSALQQKNLDIDNSQKPTSVSNTTYTDITPTLLPGKDQQHTLYKHPLDHYSFEYPSEWEIIVQKHNYSKDWYDILLTDQNDKFRIHFQVNGRGGPYFDYETTKDVNINGKNILWNNMYKNDKAFETFISFPDNDFGDKLIGLYIYLPKENQDEFNKQIEEIIASLK